MTLRAGLSIAFTILFIVGSLDAGGTSQWSEGPSDFPAGTALNINSSGGDVRLDRNLAHPANWTQMAARTEAPAHRTGHVMAYDSATDRMVFFGGHGRSYLGDTWTCNLSSNDWKQMGWAGIGGLDGAAMAFDSASGLMVLFGGWSFSSQYGYRYFNNTWVYNAGADQWTQRFPADAPSPRIGHTMSYDVSNGVIVLFGGEIYNQSQDIYQSTDDTWIYNVSANTWTSRSPAVHPSARLHHAAAFDTMNGEVVLFGGWAGREWSGTGYINLPWLGDTWTYDAGADLWTNRTPVVSPEARSEHAMTFDAAGGSIVIFGGYRGGNPGRIFNDTWTYDTGTNAWTFRSPSNSPFPQYGHAMAYDSAGGVSVLFSGRDESGNVSETWSYNASLNRWTNLIPHSGPSPRSNHAMAYDSAGGKVVLFGGQFAWGAANDTWSYDAKANLWTPAPRTSVAPPARQGHALVYDSSDGVLVLFGGSSGPSMLSDTWTYNPGTNAWVNMSPPSAPTPRAEHAMVYDTARGEVLLFGGFTVQYSPYQVILLDDMWAYNLGANRWTRIYFQTAPPARSGHAMAYDPTRGTTVLFGGSGIGSLLGDTWTYNSSLGLWSNVTPQTSPRRGFDYAMAYGGPSSDILLFGGWDGSVSVGGGTSISHAFPTETWTYRASTNTWTNRSLKAAPACRFSTNMAYDVATNALVMFGGYADQDALGDTWLFGSNAYFTDGTYTSRPLDTGGRAYFGGLEWNATIPSGTSVLFQTRAADTQENLSIRAFTGPDGTAGAYYTASGQRISGAHNGSRWVQYRACLKTTNLSRTPELKEATVRYNILQDVALLSPAGGENWTGTRRINWTASDPDNDSLSIDLYLVQGEAGTPLASGLSDLNGSWLWDTSAVPNGTYRIRLVARDDSAAIPLTAMATSAEFTVRHPGPPNHAPAVTMLAPANNSVVRQGQVQFCWSGEDEDGDPLIYNLTCWAEAPGRPVRASAMTYGTFFNATIPDDNITCYWNVTAYDGKDQSPPSPVWRFDINRTIPNHPPVITSAAPANATAGVLYQYNLTAEDPDGDSLAWKLLSRPQGMILGAVLPNNTGIRILWTPAAAQRGDCNATAEVTDGRGGRAEQTFTIHVDVLRPICAISCPSDGATVRGKLRINGTAAKGSAEIVRIDVRVDGGEWKGAEGTLLWSLVLDTTKLGNGNHTIEARATDGELFSEQAAARIIVDNRVPGPEPIRVTLEGFPWVLLAVVLCVAGPTAYMLLMLRRRRKGGGG